MLSAVSVAETKEDSNKGDIIAGGTGRLLLLDYSSTSTSNSDASMTDDGSFSVSW